ncbi:MAG: hypothetical protein KF894_29090 [Labilithrix sp.]|nr:hypothetical protein [Labilithrix sp.]
MSDPERLFDHGSPFERALLRSSESEEPASRLEEKVLASLAAAPAASEEPGGGSAGAAQDGVRLLRPMVLATLAVGLLVGGGIALGPSLTGPSVEANESAAAPAPETPAPEAPAAPSAGDVPTVSLDSLPSAPPPQAAPHAPSRATATTTTTTTTLTPDDVSSLEREIALLDAVKAKLGAGAAEGAARALDGYDAEFPQGTLRPEAVVLRIRTLLALGKRAEAERLAGDFLTRHPGSVHANRIRALLAD